MVVPVKIAPPVLKVSTMGSLALVRVLIVRLPNRDCVAAVSVKVESPLTVIALR